MKKFLKKLIAAAMAGVMAVSGLCVGASAAVTQSYDGESYLVFLNGD